MPTNRFVLYDATFRTPPALTLGEDGMPVSPPAPVVLATAADADAAATLGTTTYAGQVNLTWVEYDLEADGETRCNGRVRDDLPPHTVP